MRYFVNIIFVLFLLSNIYILRMNRKAAVKRKAFRWWLTIFAAFMVAYFLVALPDKILLVVVLPVLAGIVFGSLKFTKFCDWCGRLVQTNLPFRDGNSCPRCGSTVS